MSTFVFAAPTWSAVAVADTTAMTNDQYMAIQGGTSTQLSFIDEVYIGGQATATAASIMLLSRDSTVAATALAIGTSWTNGLLNPSGGVLTAPPVAISQSTTKPQRAATATLGRKTFTFNAFGGIVRANYANTSDRFGILGNTASLGEVSLSAFTGSVTASVGAHIIYETM